MKPKYNISPEEFDQIEQYLYGSLLSAEKASFDQKLKEDPEWAAKFNEVQLLLLGIQEEELKATLQSVHAQMKAAPEEKKITPVRSLQWRWLAAASVLIIAVVGTWWLTGQKNQKENLFSQYYSPDPGLPTTMSVNGNYQFDKGMVAYKANEFKEALAIWSELALSNPSNDTLNYFLGMTHLGLNKTEEALTLLKPIANDANKAFYKDACWYTGLLLIRTGQQDSAAPYLQKSNHPRSTELLQEIKY